MDSIDSLYRKLRAEQKVFLHFVGANRDLGFSIGVKLFDAMSGRGSFEFIRDLTHFQQETLERISAQADYEIRESA